MSDVRSRVVPIFFFFHNTRWCDAVGFAAWMQNFAADAIFPEWELWEQFIHTDQGSALKLDGLKSSHPIQALAATCVTQTHARKYMRTRAHTYRHTYILTHSCSSLHPAQRDALTAWGRGPGPDRPCGGG